MMFEEQEIEDKRLVDVVEEPIATADSSVLDELEHDRVRLRHSWELASVLNSLILYKPVLGKDLKLSAEEIEMGLIKPNRELAHLHVSLLKGIPPVNKTLTEPDMWVTVLCKKLHMWWPWVAEGDIPITAAKGEEILRYKELDPTTRLLILKALCEVRADQVDAVSFVNDALKHGTQLSIFRKEKLGTDNGITYWYDGNSVIGYRLYKEVNNFDSKLKVKGKGCVTEMKPSIHWETLATNLEEFEEVVEKFLSSNVRVEVAVAKMVQTDAISVLKRFKRNKERAMKRKHTQEMLLNGFCHPPRVEGTRTCRSRRPVNYTFDEYDRAIDEAIDERRTSKPSEKDNHGSSSDDAHNNNLARRPNNANSSDDDDYADHTDSETASDSSNPEKENDEISDENNGEGDAHKPHGSRWSKRLARENSSPVEESIEIDTKKRLRQRPTINTALDSAVVSDSENETPPENENGNASPASENVESPSSSTGTSEVSGSEAAGSDSENGGSEKSGSETAMVSDSDEEEHDG